MVSTVLVFGGGGDDLLPKKWHFIVTGVFGALGSGDSDGRVFGLDLTDLGLVEGVGGGGGCAGSSSSRIFST